MLVLVYNSPTALNNKDLHSFFFSCCIFYNLSFINTIVARYIDLGFVTLINDISYRTRVDSFIKLCTLKNSKLG